jgi:hypothetical protein
MRWMEKSEEQITSNRPPASVQTEAGQFGDAVYNSRNLSVNNQPEMPAAGSFSQGKAAIPNPVRANRGYLIALFLLFWASVMALGVAYKISFDLYTRTHWRLVEGDVISYEQQSGHISSRERPTYWIKFRVEFDPKEAGCNTGESWSEKMRFPCIGMVRSPGSKSLSRAMSWAERHPPNSAAKFLYDPASGRLRFAGESVWNIYPWGAIVAVVVSGMIGILLYRTSRQRFVANDSDSIGSAESESRPDEIIDLKLS